MNRRVEAGASSVVITPAKPVYLAGLDRRSTGCELSQGVHDDLYAKCLLLRVGDTQLGFLSLDLIGIFYDDVEEFRRLAFEAGLESEGVIVSSTHQHSGPDTLGLWGPEPTVSGVDSEYMRFLKKRMVDVLYEASRNLKPARLKLSRTRMPNGVARNSRDPNLLDDEITVLSVEDLKGSNIAVLANFGLHPEVLWSDNNLITADFPCYMYRRVESETKGLCIFINGALGGMVTPSVKEHSFKEAERIGSTIGEAILKSLDEAESLEEAELKVLSEKVHLPVKNEKFKDLSRLGVIRRQLKNGLAETRLTVASLKNVSFVTVPGEPLPKVGLDIKSFMPGKFKFLIALGNDELGYIIHPEDWADGRYEESMSIGPETAPILIERIKHIINHM